VITFGRINPNKSPELVIRAIGAHPKLAESIEYRLVGIIDEDFREELATLSAQLGVTLGFRGEVDDAELTAEILVADLVINIRNPAFEGASASAIDAMLLSKPMAVANHGFYASLPPDAVFKLSLDHLQDELEDVLHNLVRSEDHLASFGARARVYAEATFRSDLYVDQMIELVGTLTMNQAELEASRKWGRTLRAWGGVSDQDLLQPIFESISFLAVEKREI
jgi:glycosyltransferase involved in cell wall biosynthesis